MELFLSRSAWSAKSFESVATLYSRIAYISDSWNSSVKFDELFFSVYFKFRVTQFFLKICFSFTDPHFVI